MATKKQNEMAQPLKPKGHYDLIHNPAYRRNYDCKLSSHKRLRTSQVVDERTGKICNKSEFVPVDRVKEMENYSVNDFALENLLAVGAKLDAVTLSMDSLSSVDGVASTLASIPTETPTE